MIITRAAVLGVTSLALAPLSSPALAQDAVEAPQIQQSAPAPGAHLHDGFYLRLGTGCGAYNESVRRKGTDEDTTITGMATVSELAIGGALRPGFILGGGAWSSTVLASSRTVRGTVPPADVADSRGDFSIVGPFAYYTDPRKGFHVQAGVGIANVRGVKLDAFSYDKETISVGVGMMFGVGYDWWVSDNWSLGILGRLTAAATTQKDLTGARWYQFAGGTPSVLFTGTYN